MFLYHVSVVMCAQNNVYAETVNVCSKLYKIVTSEESSLFPFQSMYKGQLHCTFEVSNF